MILLFGIASILGTLSFLGSLSILIYLWATESQAPKFNQLIIEGQNRTLTPKVSVVVTARNEEQMIGNCLESLAAQTFENMEIVVVDDSSINRTREIVKSAMTFDKKLNLIDAGIKPEGWIGKSWPCWRGFEESEGEYLLFVDADSTFEKTVVERCITYVTERSIDMFSLSPKIRVTGVWAKTVLPLISGGINLLYPMKKVNDSKSKRAYVFGTFILVRKNVYEKTGGHKQVRNQIVEDAAIAQLVKSSGFNLRIERGPQYLSTEWENDLGSIFSGLERVTSTSIKSYGLISILNAILLFFLMIYPIIFLLVFASVANFNEVLVEGAIASLLSVIIFIILGAFEMRTVTGKIDPSVFLYFLGGIIFIVAIITTSLKIARGKEIYWKGQGYNLAHMNS